MRRAAALLLALAAMLASASHATAAAPPIKHVFVIVLENEDADSTFGPDTKAPYLARTLTSQGMWLRQYYAIGHLSLGNYIAMVSGQGPNPYTQADAPVYADFVPGTPGPDGQALGQGSVYPASVKTIADQLEEKSLTWKGYMEDMGTPCRHPAVGAPDNTQSARADDQYATRHNPFVYFHSIVDRPSCAQNDVPLERLPGDLKSASTTASYSFITPDLCSDGHDEPCIDGRPGGMTSANDFLKTWVPRITSSPAYRDSGLLIITFDEAENHDASACCGEQQGPNTPNNGGPTPGAGGGRIGAVLLSPFIAGGGINDTPYNHYSFLRSMEDLFGLDHLGFAGRDGLKPFEADVYTQPGGAGTAGSKPRVSIGGVRSRGCARSSFRARIKAKGHDIEAVTVQLDHHKVKSSRRTRFGVNIHGSELRRGRHELTARVRDGALRRARRTVGFTHC